MGRRTSGGQIGLEKIGNIQANGNTLTTATTNADLTLDPNGTGGVLIVGDMTIVDQGDLRLREASGNGTNYLAMQAATSMSANYTITWPSAVGSANQVLQTDASGNLSWVSPSTFGIVAADPGASATVHYPLFETNAGSITSGTLTTIKNRSNLTFVPSTGELFSTIGRHPDVIGSSSNSGTITIRGTSSATKATASVLLTDNVTSSSTTTGTLVVTGGVGVSGAIYSASGVVNGTWRSLRTENGKTSSYTLGLTDQDVVVSFSGSGAQTVTVPSDSTANFPTGSVIYINRVGSGTLALAAEGGVTISKTGSFGSNEEIYVRKRGSNSWIVVDAPKNLSATGGTLSTGGGFNIHSYTSTGSSTFVVG